MNENAKRNWPLILAMMAMSLLLGSMGINHVVDALESGRQFRLALGCVMIACAVLAAAVCTWILFRTRG